MNELEKKSSGQEPEESGAEQTQEVGTTAVPADVLEKSHDGIEGHPLPDTLRALATVFRSHPAWMLIVQWVSQVTKESEQNKQDLSRTRDELQKEKIRSATLEERLSGVRQIAPLKTLVQATGTLIIGLSATLYQSGNSIFYAAIFLAVGIVMMVAGWLLRGSKA